MQAILSDIVARAAAHRGLMIFLSIAIFLISLFYLLPWLNTLRFKRRCWKILNLLAEWTGEGFWRDVATPHECLNGDVYFRNEDRDLDRTDVLSFEETLHRYHLYFPSLWLVILRGLSTECRGLTLSVCFKNHQPGHYLLDFIDEDRRRVRIITPDEQRVIIAIADDQLVSDLYAEILDFITSDEHRRLFGGQQLKEL